MERDPKILERFHLRFLHEQLTIHKLRKEYDDALMVARQLEERHRAALQDGSALETCASEMESMLLDPEVAKAERRNIFQTLFRKSHSSLRNHIDAVLELAEIQVLQRDWAGAKATILNILSCYEKDGMLLQGMTVPQYFRIVVSLPQCLYELGEYEAAISYGTAAIAIDRNHPGCHRYIILAYLALPNKKYRHALHRAAEAVIYEATWDEEHHAITKDFYREHFLR